MITKPILLNVVVLVMAFLPFITYIDYYLLKNIAICKRCGLKPNKHAFLLATFLETMFFIAGILLGMLVD
jgi:hypothetical protein